MKSHLRLCSLLPGHRTQNGDHTGRGGGPHPGSWTCMCSSSSLASDSQQSPSAPKCSTQRSPEHLLGCQGAAQWPTALFDSDFRLGAGVWGLVCGTWPCPDGSMRVLPASPSCRCPMFLDLWPGFPEPRVHSVSPPTPRLGGVSPSHWPLGLERRRRSRNRDRPHPPSPLGVGLKGTASPRWSLSLYPSQSMSL